MLGTRHLPAAARPPSPPAASDRFRTYAPPAAFVLGVVALWQLGVRAFDVPAYLLPAPSEIVEALRDDWALLASSTWVTVQEMLLGFGLAALVGVVLAVILHLSPLLRRAVYPLLIASQAIPIVVFAPILVIVMGFNMWPKVTIVALVCFFPIVVSGVDGLGSVDRELVRMMITLHASRWAIFTRVELPSALPPLFSGARVAATYAAIGAVFGEWAGSNEGLGHVILQASPTLATARIFAAGVVLTVMSLALFAAVSLTERIVVPWAGER
ncbi:MAG TPA: ABC transporter permease [Actinomycetota bacterium]|nr:ABC transporter permease [Actinomycetota bacterium]